MHKRGLNILLIVLAVASIIMAACTGDSNDGKSADQTPTPSTTPAPTALTTSPTGTPTPTATAIAGPTGPEWSFAEDDVALDIPGVSPEAILLEDGSVRLYVTDMGMKVYRSEDGLAFDEENVQMPPGSHPPLIPLSNGGYRMYYVDMINNTQTICTATSSDGLTWTEEACTSIKNSSGNQAWGVPDSVECPDGSIRLYWVDMPPTMGFGTYEVIKSAISEDGVDFTIEDGYRTEDGYVDSYVLIAEEGNWVGLFATTPAPERLPQEIFIGTSTDGLTWEIKRDPIITVEGGNALDPTAVPLENGSWRVYYSSTPGSDPFAGFTLQSGVLSLTTK